MFVPRAEVCTIGADDVRYAEGGIAASKKGGAPWISHESVTTEGCPMVGIGLNNSVADVQTRTASCPKRGESLSVCEYCGGLFRTKCVMHTWKFALMAIEFAPVERRWGRPRRREFDSGKIFERLPIFSAKEGSMR
jgi:hypothetical protein